MGSSKNKSSSNYRDAGVDLDAAEDAVERYRGLVAKTRIPGVLADIGGFGGLFSLREAGVDLGADADPVLVSATDGVGTKLKLAFQLDRHDTIGVDCVAMCVNDVVTTGARPLLFLDYLATGKLRPEQAEAIVAGVARGCRDSGCALIGGETAEMPGFYAEGEYDVAGFCVGVVDRGRILAPERVQAGDVAVGLGSSGFHSNGYSLVRKIVADASLDLGATYPELGEATLGELLLEPTKLYVSVMNALNVAGKEDLQPHAAAHITGGGFYENLPRVLPEGLGVRVDPARWPRPPVIDFIADHGGLDPVERFNVFNMGVGMVLFVAPTQVERVVALAGDHGHQAWPIGEVVDRAEGEAQVIVEGVG